MKTIQDPIIISYLGLRRIVGSIGFGLPIALLVSSLAIGDICPSISQFYYSFMRDVFVGSMCIIGLFLLSYGGYKKEEDERISDRTLGIITGVAAIGLALFPTTGQGLQCSVNPIDSELVGYLHLGFALVFLSGIGTFSYFKFSRTKSGPVKTFKTLGVVIFVCIGVLGVGKILIMLNVAVEPVWDWTFWFESIAVWCFGASWLIKGKTMAEITRLKTKVMNLYRSS